MELLSTNHFQLVINRLPDVAFWTKGLQIPSLDIGSAAYPNPVKDLNVPGEKLTVGDLTVTFSVDENFENYLQIIDWMVGIATPEKLEDYKKFDNPEDGIYSDATTVVLNSRQNPSFEVVYYNIWPKSLSEINFDNKQTAITHPECTVVFDTQGYDIRKIK